jgi:hypothetical protein
VCDGVREPDAGEAVRVDDRVMGDGVREADRDREACDGDAGLADVVALAEGERDADRESVLEADGERVDVALWLPSPPGLRVRLGVGERPVGGGGDGDIDRLAAPPTTYKPAKPPAKLAGPTSSTTSMEWPAGTVTDSGTLGGPVGSLAPCHQHASTTGDCVSASAMITAACMASHSASRPASTKLQCHVTVAPCGATISQAHCVLGGREGASGSSPRLVPYEIMPDGSLRTVGLSSGAQPFWPNAAASDAEATSAVRAPPQRAISPEGTIPASRGEGDGGGGGGVGGERGEAAQDRRRLARAPLQAHCGGINGHSGPGLRINACVKACGRTRPHGCRPALVGAPRSKRCSHARVAPRAYRKAKRLASLRSGARSAALT